MPYTIDDVVSGEAKIKIVGVGGAGGNAVKNMIEDQLSGVNFIITNTDSQALDSNPAPIKIQIGEKLTGGLGAGADPEKGRKAAEENIEGIKKEIEGADMVFIAAGMGGGTGTGAAPVIAKVAKESGALTVGVVTKPFLFEGRKRKRQAEEGIAKLEKEVDALIVIPNDKILTLSRNIKVRNGFQKADEILLDAAKGITDLIVKHGEINVDFMDVRSVMMEKGRAIMGIGVAKGENAAAQAVEKAISSPLLEDISINGATGVLININCSEDFPLMELSEAVMLVEEKANEDANIIFGTVLDEDLDDEVRVTIIATGFVNNQEKNKPEKATENFEEENHAITKKNSQLSMNYKIKSPEEINTRRPSSEIPKVRNHSSRELPVVNPENKNATPVNGETDFSKPAYLRRLNTKRNLQPLQK
ncbi:MAG: cell division protein FtsZ [Myxococcota bacterium]